MTDRLSGVVLLPTDGASAGPPVDLSIRDGRIAEIPAAAAPPTRRLLAMPALVNAHDHARPLSPTSFGAAGKPLEAWLLRLGAMPAIDPYLGAVAALGRAARAGAGSVMAHYTRFHGPMAPIDEAKEIARAARDVGVRVTLAVFMRDRNPLVYDGEDSVLMKLPDDARAAIETQFLSGMPGVVEQIASVEEIAAETESDLFSVQFGPSGPQWCSDELIAGIAEASRVTGRRVHMHLLETRYQRAFADRAYPEGVVERLKTLGLLTPRLTLAHCVHARPAELDAIAAAGAPGPGALTAGAPADILVLDLDALDRDAVMAVEPIDLVFARASAAHVARLVVAGEEIARDGRIVRVDVDAAESALRRQYRANMRSRAAFLAAWGDLEPAVA